jgi:hypothetical protein
MYDPNVLDSKEFVKQYLTLSDRVEGLGPGKKLVNSLFHYFSAKNTENVRQRNILIGVITAQEYLLTRAITIYRTWGAGLKDVGEGHNHIFFFVGEDCKTDDPRLKNMPIVKLPGIQDDVYPPQKKVFAVLKYFHSQFAGQYKWFVRADDDVYIHVEKLESMLQEWDWTDALMLGHPGYGIEKERKRLKLLPHEIYCMGGPSVVFSVTAVKALSPYLHQCLAAVEHHNQGKARKEKWFNEDVELGRCASRTVGITCSQVATVRRKVIDKEG